MMGANGVVLNELQTEDIDEKIRLNEAQGIDIVELRGLIAKELKAVEWIKIRAIVSSQFYKEQLEHIDYRISQLEKQGV